MASQDDFFYNLNGFSSGVNNDHPTPSTRAHDKSNSNNVHHSTSILAGLNAFTPDDAEMESNASANFADQLALWTNANFSFDGPTGHALLLDDEKDEEAKREDRERRDREDAARSNPANTSRRGESSRDGANGNHTGANTPIDGVSSGRNGLSTPQHNHHFASPASVMGEGRRPGYNAAANNGSIADRKRAENSFAAFNFMEDAPTAEQKSSAQAPPQNPEPQPQQQQQQQALDQANYVNQFGGFGLGAGVGGMSPELLQALAFQQILSGGSNPANLASLFGGGAAGGPQLAHGAFPAMQNGAFVPPAGLGSHQAPFGAAPGWGFGGAMGPQQHAVPNSSKMSHTDSTDGKRNSEEEDEQPNGKKRRQSSKTSSKNEESALARQKREEQEEMEKMLRDDLPPLELIDTGNPEADAEANRVAVEEDKRRRNTAASARFRIKKKQREQALEQAAKELERRVHDLEEENNRLTTENGWLKSLITIRPSGQAGPAIGPLTAHQLAQGATFLGSGMQPQRDTGLQPRGVGTADGVVGNMPSQQHQQQQQQPTASVLTGGKRDRDE